MKTFTAIFSLAHCQNKIHCRCVQVSFQFVWSSVYGYQHCNFFAINLQTKRTDSGQKVLEGMQKFQLFERCCKTRITRRYVRYFPSMKLFQNFGIWYFVKMIQTPSLCHGICLFTACWCFPPRPVCPVGIWPKVLFLFCFHILLATHSLSCL